MVSQIILCGLYDTRKFKANDTSFGVGFAPFTDTETLVKLTEKYINGDLKKSLPAIGYDIKVMGFEIRDSETIMDIIKCSLSEYYTKSLILDLYRACPQAFIV